MTQPFISKKYNDIVFSGFTYDSPIFYTFNGLTQGKGGGTGGARGAIAPPLFTDHLKIINYSQ